MKLSLSVFLSAVLASAANAQMLEVRAQACPSNGNNCQRQIGGTAGVKPPLSSRLADCSRLNTVTVTPAPFTTTITTTYTVWNGFTLKKRAEIATATTELPTSVPPYATFCSSAAAYYSACSCAGVTPAITSAPVPTVTEMASTTITCFAERKIKRGIEMVKNLGGYLG